MSIDIITIDSTSSDNPIFDLPVVKTKGKKRPGYFLNKSGNAQKAEGVRMSIPLFKVTPKRMAWIAWFVGDIDEVLPRPKITLVVKEATKEEPAKMGVFAI
jgi:hypothetical protein